MKRRSAMLIAVASAVSVLAMGAFAQQSSDDQTKTTQSTDKKTSDKSKKEKPKPKKDDPDAIGDRDVGSGINFYGLDSEIAMGKQLAQAVERDAKVIDDPVIAEYVNRVGQNLVRNSD